MKQLLLIMQFLLIMLLLLMRFHLLMQLLLAHPINLAEDTILNDVVALVDLFRCFYFFPTDLTDVADSFLGG